MPARGESLIDRFAELLSLDIPVPAICERLGIASSYGRVLLQRIIKGLGAEQCR